MPPRAGSRPCPKRRGQLVSCDAPLVVDVDVHERVVVGAGDPDVVPLLHELDRVVE